MSGMKNVARARQAQAFKDMYGFSDAQSKKYFAKEDQLNKDKEAQMTTLREKFTATKDKEQKRIIVRQLATLQANSGKKMRDAMLSVATAAQRQRIQTNQ